MIELYLMRHAESENNAVPEKDRKIGGRASAVPLTRLGVGQAWAAGEELARAKIRFDGIFCSAAVRARQTLENALARAPALRDAPVVFSGQIEEREQGAWAGLRVADVYTRETVADICAAQLDHKPEGGESFREAGARMMAFVCGRILLRHRRGVFLLLGHGLATRCFLHACFNFPPQLVSAIPFGNACFSKLVFEDGAWRMKYWNQRWLL
ncbi:MAG: histidine phosphatase family protein [Opitutaceae bacterium]|jgi:probable phosphoglycerate mutase|nr:histidine phosphatase family protein [Opitutaceae bacterium]